MTKKEAIALEALCEKWLYQVLVEDVEISMNFTGRLKITFNEGSTYICINKDLKSVGWIKYSGDFEDLTYNINGILDCIAEHEDDFILLLWSYENQSSLED